MIVLKRILLKYINLRILKKLENEKADNELKKTCVKIIAKFISPKETIKNGTMNN